MLDESIAGDRQKRDAIVSAVTKAVGLEQLRDPEVDVLIDRLPGVSPPKTEAAPRGLDQYARPTAVAVAALADTATRRSVGRRPNSQ